jgi:hypothetical protein
MTNWVVGQTVTFGLKTFGTDGTTLTDVGVGPTVVVVLPDGVTTASGSVTRASTGTYYASLTATIAGRYRATWSGSGAASGGLPYVDYLDVQAAAPRMLIPLSEARDALKLPATTTVHDDEILGYILAATPVIEDITGPILSATRVETYDGSRASGAALPLHAYPNAITSVVEDGTTLAATAYKVGQGGVLWRVGTTWSTLSPGNIVVTYTVGSGVIPPNVILAAREEVRHLYQVGQVASRPALGTAQAPGMAYTPTGFAVPHRVIELLADQVGAQGLGVH